VRILCIKLNKAKIKFIILIIFFITILIMPILAIQNNFVKQLALLLFNNPHNAEIYLLFCGTFLGTIVAITGVFIGSGYKKSREKESQCGCIKLPNK